MQKHNIRNAISIPLHDYNDLQSLNLRSVKYSDRFNKAFLMKPIHFLSAAERAKMVFIGVLIYETGYPADVRFFLD